MNIIYGNSLDENRQNLILANGIEGSFPPIRESMSLKFRQIMQRITVKMKSKAHHVMAWHGDEKMRFACKRRGILSPFHLSKIDEQQQKAGRTKNHSRRIL